MAAAETMLRAIRRQRGDADVGYFDDPRKQEEMWLIRESGLGATARVPCTADPWSGWEDSAVAPERLGDRPG